MCKCNRHSIPAGMVAGNRNQAQILGQGLDRRSYGSRSSRFFGLRDPEEENLLPPVADPEEENLLPPVADPDDLNGGSGNCGCCCDCAAGTANMVYVPVCKSEDEAGQQSAHLPELCYSGFIIVRLAPGNLDEAAETLDDLAEKLELTGLLKLLKLDEAPSPMSQEDALVPRPEDTELFLPSRPLIRNTCHTVPGCGTFYVRSKLVELTNKAPTPRPAAIARSLLSTWRIDCRQYPDRILGLVTALQALPIVELAYREALADDPSVNAGSLFDNDQSYLDDAPFGIGARWAKALLEEHQEQEGQEQLSEQKLIRCCDIEQRWIINHSELENRIESRLDNDEIPFFGDNLYEETKDGNHGTAVSAQLVGDTKIEGIANEVIEYDIASHYDAGNNGNDTGSNGNIAEAVVNTLVMWYVLSDSNLKSLRGDVILIEVQRCGLVAEIDHADFHAFLLATALGVVVVEAAGNAGFDLDTYQDEQGRRTLRRGGPNFRDSGAVVVGAAWSALPHDRASFSNYGSRVDCYGWGDSVVSAGYGDYDPGDGQPPSWYTSSFSGTSSAAPMIAGVAAWVQCLTRNATKCALDPREVRALLADRAIGTPQGPGVRGNIGVMPNLCAILEQASLGLPQPYLRRTTADNGWDCRRIACSSPDIMVGPGTDPDLLKHTVGKKGNHRPAPGFSPIPETAQGDGYVFCRARNRGLGDIHRKAHLFFSEPATLINPAMWTRIDETSSGNIGQGGNAAFLGPVHWTPPLPAHYALLAALGSKDSLDPLSRLCLDWSAYRDFLRRADVGCRNTHWLDVPTPSPPASKTNPFEFSFTGAPDRLRTFDFEIVQRLPAGVTVQLTVPEIFAVKLRQSQPWAVDWPAKLEMPIDLPPTPRLAFQRIRLPAGASCAASLWLKGNVGAVERRHSVAIRQIYRGEEVGRLTCYFNVI